MTSRKINPLLLFFFGLACVSSLPARVNTPVDTMAIYNAITNFNQGLIESNAQRALTAFDDNFTMFNGNYSCSLTDWQAHLFLEGDDLKDWVEMFVTQAGPHEFSYQFVHFYERGNSALVVTQETGKNKFRSWQNQQVAWVVGKTAKGWKIVSMFIKDIRNPE